MKTTELEAEPATVYVDRSQYVDEKKYIDVAFGKNPSIYTCNNLELKTVECA